MTSLEAERAVRQASALLMSSHISVIEVCGTGAFECLDRLLACDLFLYDGQARQTVILDELGSVIADVTVAKVDGLFRLFVDGLTAAELRALIEVEVRDLLDEHALVSLHGPFAWELAAMWLGRAVVSLLAELRSIDGCAIVLLGALDDEDVEVLLQVLLSLPGSPFTPVTARTKERLEVLRAHSDERVAATANRILEQLGASHQPLS